MKLKNKSCFCVIIFMFCFGIISIIMNNNVNAKAKNKYSKKEDKALVELFFLYGEKYRKIAKMMPTKRTDNSVYCRLKSLERSVRVWNTANGRIQYYYKPLNYFDYMFYINNVNVYNN